VAVFPELRRAYRDGLADPQSMSIEELDEAEAAPPGTVLEATRTSHSPIDDVARATSWWSSFAGEDDDVNDELVFDDGAVVERQEPYRAPPKVGRNDACPCGSGKKYKRCCGR
jgi:preprotein translocase subunit SecA